MRCQPSLMHRQLRSVRYGDCALLKTACQVKQQRCSLRTVTSFQSQRDPEPSKDDVDRTLQTRIPDISTWQPKPLQNPFFPSPHVVSDESDEHKILSGQEHSEEQAHNISSRQDWRHRPAFQRRLQSSDGDHARDPSNSREGDPQDQKSRGNWTTNGHDLETHSEAPPVRDARNVRANETSTGRNVEYDEMIPEPEQHTVILDKYRSLFENEDPTTEIYPYTLDYSTSIHMTQTLRKLRDSSFPNQITAHGDPRNHAGAHSLDFPHIRATKIQSKLLRKRLLRKEQYSENHQLKSERLKLPIQQRGTAKKLMQMVESNDVVILVSQTGSGKTTQLPQLILDWQTRLGKGALCNIVCTQPRRLAAMSIARRVAKEQETYVGGHVGYSVRFDKHMPQRPGSISYWTAAILLKALYEQPEAIINTYAYLVIDEVHERDITTDLVLTTIRDLMRSRSQAGKHFPKVILMSATIDALDFQRYFADPYPGPPLKVASLEVPGRNFGVQVHTLDNFLPDLAQYAGNSRFMSLMQSSRRYFLMEDEFAEKWNAANDDLSSTSGELESPQRKRPRQAQRTEAEDVQIELTTAIIAHALKSSEDGDVLVFLPGLGEIDKVYNCLRAHPLLELDFTDTNTIRIYKLHASLYETNEQVFDSVPKGCRRIVLATNIAQTSITLPDVVHVVDVGQQRNVSFNPISRVNEFKAYWIDKSAATQRQGRAGRTRPGHYWTLFTQARYDSFPEKPLPEIKTTDLTPTCLAIKARAGNKDSIKSFLERVMNPPDSEMIKPAVEELKKLRMVDDNEQITPMGRFAAWFPLPPATARALLLGILFRCFEPLLIMASHNADKPLIHNTSSLKSQIQSLVSFAEGADDDRAAFVAAFRSYDSAVTTGSAGTIAELENLNVKSHAYREILSVAEQLVEMLSAYQLLDVGRLKSGSLFRQLPRDLSENASSRAFVRSLGLSMQHANLGVYNAKGNSYYVNRTPVLMKPFSVNAKSPMEMAGHPDTRGNGQLIAYSLLMQLPGTALPFMTETSNVTPLMAMLFGGPIEVLNENTVQINGWLKYQISTTGQDGRTVADDGSAVGLILEFRRTLDRFVQMACISLRKGKPPPGPSIDEDELQKSPLVPGNILTDTITQGLKAVIDSDASHWDAILLRRAAEAAASDKSRREKPQGER